MPASLTLEYIGNSCVVVTAPDGTCIVSDPYHDEPRPPCLERMPDDLTAVAVTVSHAHEDHCNSAVVGGSPQVLAEGGVFQIGSIKVTGFPGWEGSPHGPSENFHVVFMFECAGVRIVQMSDSGPITDPDVLKAIENADVLMANIDGYVIPPEQIIPFLEKAHVRTFIPMHYSLSPEARWQGAPTPEEFVAGLPADWPAVKEGTILQVKAGMPRQVLTMVPRMLEKASIH